MVMKNIVVDKSTDNAEPHSICFYHNIQRQRKLLLQSVIITQRNSRSVYHLSTKTENSGGEIKCYNSFHRKVSEKDGNPQTYSSLLVATEVTGNS